MTLLVAITTAATKAATASINFTWGVQFFTKRIFFHREETCKM